MGQAVHACADEAWASEDEGGSGRFAVPGPDPKLGSGRLAGSGPRAIPARTPDTETEPKWTDTGKGHRLAHRKPCNGYVWNRTSDASPGVSPDLCPAEDLGGQLLSGIAPASNKDSGRRGCHHPTSEPEEQKTLSMGHHSHPVLTLGKRTSLLENSLRDNHGPLPA
jgi:hypothetical protein